MNALKTLAAGVLLSLAALAVAHDGPQNKSRPATDVSWPSDDGGWLPAGNGYQTRRMTPVVSPAARPQVAERPQIQRTFWSSTSLEPPSAPPLLSPRPAPPARSSLQLRRGERTIDVAERNARWRNVSQPSPREAPATASWAANRSSDSRSNYNRSTAGPSPQRPVEIQVTELERFETPDWQRDPPIRAAYASHATTWQPADSQSAPPQTYYETQSPEVTLPPIPPAPPTSHATPTPALPPGLAPADLRPQLPATSGPITSGMQTTVVPGATVAPADCGSIYSAPTSVVTPAPQITAAPAPVSVYSPAAVYPPAAARFAAGSPGAMLGPGMEVRRGLLGQPMIRVDGQPLRNFLRWVTP